MLQKLLITKRRFAITANSLGISKGTVGRGWPMRPEERSHKHKHAKLKSLMKKKKTSLPQCEKVSKPCQRLNEGTSWEHLLTSIFR
jgi:hypothetical protein